MRGSGKDLQEIWGKPFAPMMMELGGERHYLDRFSRRDIASAWGLKVVQFAFRRGFTTEFTEGTEEETKQMRVRHSLVRIRAYP